MIERKMVLLPSSKSVELQMSLSIMGYANQMRKPEHQTGKNGAASIKAISNRSRIGSNISKVKGTTTNTESKDLHVILR